MTTQNSCAIAPVVSIINNTVTALSTDVARYFERPHDYVLKAIRTILENAKNAGLSLVKNYESIKYRDLQGIERPAFRMDRKGFVLLAMGFTGVNALKFKNNYIDTFDRMEEQLRKQQSSADNTSLITPEQQYEISSHVMRKTHALFGNRNYSAVYRALKRRFRIPRYTCLLSRDYEMALKFIDSLTKDDFNVPDVSEESTQEIQEVSKTAIVKPMTRRLYQVNSYSFTFNVNNMESFEKPSKVVTELPYLPKRRIEITEEELHSIKVLVYYFEVLFKPLIQWAEQEARRQHHPLASRFYDVWCEPIISMSALKRIIRRNDPDYV